MSLVKLHEAALFTESIHITEELQQRTTSTSLNGLTDFSVSLHTGYLCLSFHWLCGCFIYAKRHQIDLRGIPDCEIGKFAKCYLYTFHTPDTFYPFLLQELNETECDVNPLLNIRFLFPLFSYLGSSSWKWYQMQVPGTLRDCLGAFWSWLNRITIRNTTVTTILCMEQDNLQYCAKGLGTKGKVTPHHHHHQLANRNQKVDQSISQQLSNKNLT